MTDSKPRLCELSHAPAASGRPHEQVRALRTYPMSYSFHAECAKVPVPGYVAETQNKLWVHDRASASAPGWWSGCTGFCAHTLKVR